MVFNFDQEAFVRFKASCKVPLGNSSAQQICWDNLSLVKYSHLILKVVSSDNRVYLTVHKKNFRLKFSLFQ
jgi:hypothetical protein